MEQRLRRRSGYHDIAHQWHVDYWVDHRIRVFNEGDLFYGVAGQVLHGLLSIVCFALVGVVFWRFGWKVGVIDLALLFIASNVGLTFCTYVRKRSGL